MLLCKVILEGIKMCEFLQLGVLIEKLPLSWKNFLEQFNHKKKRLQELIDHIKIEKKNQLQNKGYYTHNSTNAKLLQYSCKFDTSKGNN